MIAARSGLQSVVCVGAEADLSAAEVYAIDRPRRFPLGLDRSRRWARGLGADALSPRTTLTDFARRWYLPRWPTGRRVKPRTVAEFHSAVNAFVAAVGDLPLGDVDQEALYRCRAVLEARGLASHTIHKYQQTLQSVLNHAGPTGQRCRSPATLYGLFGRDPEMGWPLPAPIFPPITCTKTDKPILSHDQLVSLVDACDVATKPDLGPKWPAPDWWRSLLRFLFWTGLRIDTGLHAARSWRRQTGPIHWLEIPGDHFKGGRKEGIWLHAQALSILDSLPQPAGEDRYFPWPASIKELHHWRRAILVRAGLPVLPVYGFHALRRTVGDALYGVNPMAARLFLHHDPGVTAQHYTSVDGRVRAQAELCGPILDRLSEF